jgi:type IV pilus assembly protein PilQ
MYPKLSIFHPTIILSIFFLFILNILSLHSAFAESTPVATDSVYLIQDIKANQQEDVLNIEISGNKSPQYTTFELYNPTRLILDIAQASLDKKIDHKKIIPDNSYAKITSKPVDKDPNTIRFEITISESHTYSVDRDKNNLLIQLRPKKDSLPATASTAPNSGQPAPVAAVQNNASPVVLQNITIKKSAEQSEILIIADAPIKDFRHNVVVGKKDLPDMMFVDITGADAGKLAQETEVGTALSRIRVAPKGTGARLLFDSGLPTIFDYTVTTDPKGLLITINEKAGNAKVAKAAAGTTLAGLIDSSATAMSKAKTKEKSGDAKSAEHSENTFDFGGYKGAKRVSVDFFKIDLHNVFRLFREISGINIIVDEAVKGSLTLALNDVPWDFALDIILNLKDLRKEERFNTIVIYPAEKAFVWPERAQDNLSVEANLEIVQQEKNALVIEQTAAQSEEMTKSKELISQGRTEEKADNMEKAVALYEQALKLDPKNAKLANRLASLYLANLGMHAKALHFAKEGLKIEPKNTKSALYAAIALANMNMIAEATDYFAQSISGPAPQNEALISYASFSEQNGQSDGALKLIARYNTLYGESVETMVAKARIYDKMGQKDKANDQYKALLASGYQLAPGLKEYIQSRLVTGNNAPGI